MTFEEFLDAELSGLRRYAAALTGDSQRAHDVLADALLKAHTAWERIGSMEFPLAYVRRMVTFTFLSEKRRWSARSIRVSPSGELPDASLPDPAADVDDRDQLRQLLVRLPRRQRAAVVLRYYLDVPDAAIADELGITQAAVRTMISRALASLRIAVSQEEPGSADLRTDSHADAHADAAVPGLPDVTGVRPRLQEGS